jgi:hypothetical protein
MAPTGKCSVEQTVVPTNPSEFPRNGITLARQFIISMEGPSMVGLPLAHRQHLSLGIAILLSMSSTSGFFPPRTSPTCVRSLAGRLEQEANIAAAETKQQHQEKLTLAAAMQGQRMAVANPSHEAGNTTVEINLRQSRNSIFRLAALAGQASALFLDEEDYHEEHERGGVVAAANDKTRTEQALARILIALMNSAKVMNVDLEKACHAKIDLNCKKYPVDLCKVSRIFRLASIVQ